MLKSFVQGHRGMLDRIAAWLDHQQKEDYYNSVRSKNDYNTGLALTMLFVLAASVGSCSASPAFPPLMLVAVLGYIVLTIALGAMLVMLPFALAWTLIKYSVYLLVILYLKLGYFDDKWLHKLAGLPYTAPAHKQRYTVPMKEWTSKMTDAEGKALPPVMKDRD